MPKINKSTVDKIEPQEKDIFVWDDEVKGFGVRVQPSGTKSYLVRYRTLDGVQRKQKLGRTNVLSPAEARELARKVLGEVASGKDPLQARRDDKESPTILDLRDRYMTDHAIPFKKASSRDLDVKNWRLYIIPAIGDRKVRDIVKADVLKIFGGLVKTPASANQSLALLSKAMNLAEEWKWRPTFSNPCYRIKKYKLKKHNLILTADQITRLNVTMTKMVEERRLDQTFADFVRLLQLTGCRKNEILKAELSWLDRDNRVLRLPDSKVGPRDIQFSEAAMEIIDGMKGKFLVGATSNKPYITVYRMWQAVKKEAELPPKLRFHDLRHTAGSLAHMAGMSQRQIADLLGHAVLATTDKYIHSHDGNAALAANLLGNVITASWAKPKAEEVPA